METKQLELIVQELQNRIGQITSQYETQMAVLKSQALTEISERDKIISELKLNVDKVDE